MDRTPVPLKIASLVSAGQKVVAVKPDTSSEIAIDSSQAMRRSSDAQKDSAATSAESTGRPAPALQNWDAIRQQLGQIVSSAHLAEAMGQSELQVDMKSDSLGPVSVRATLNNGQIGAEIQVSNHDARAVLTEGLHTLEKTLGEKGLQVVNLDVSQGLNYSHAQSQGQQGKQAGQPAHAAKGYADHSASKAEPSAVSNTVNWTSDFVLGRVSVHA
jgi:flagellar hook-length control protein FliK